MILIDTSVVIDFWRKPSPELAGAFSRPDLFICGIVISELLYGARTPQELVTIERRAEGLKVVPIEERVWPAVGRNLQALRTAGLLVPFQDVVLATLAILNDAELWTSDLHFQQIQKVLTNLRLFSGPKTKS